MKVANGGKLYSCDATGQWYEWSGTQFLAWVDPALESTRSADDTAVQAGSCGGLVTSDGVWTFSTAGVPTPMFGNDVYGDCVMAGRGHQTLRFELIEQNKIIKITIKM